MPVSRERFDTVVAENDAYRLQIDQLHDELAAARAAARIGGLVEQAMEDEEFKGLVAEDADAAAAAVVAQQERERLTAEMSQVLQSDRREAYTAEFRANEGPAIHRHLDEVFQNDGTYDDIEDDVRGIVHAEVQEDLLDEKRRAIRAELETPEGLAELKAAIVAEESFVARVETVRQETRNELEKKWDNQWMEEKRAEVIAEEEAKEPEFKSRRYLTDTGKRQMEDLRQKTRQELEQKWGDEWYEDEKHEEVDDVTKQLIKERNELAQAKLSKENTAQKLLAEFHTGGIDMSKIEAGSMIKIYLGNFQSGVMREEKDQSNRVKNVKKNVVQYDRYIRLSSLGEGRFIVEHDSLAESGKSAYVQNDAVECGVVLAIGRLQSENGHAVLLPRIADNVQLAFSTDADDPSKTVVTPSCVANVIIDGVSVYSVDLYETI